MWITGLIGGFIKSNLGTVKLIGYAFIILSVLGYVGYLEVQVNNLSSQLVQKEKDRKEAVSLANSNADQAKKLKADFNNTLVTLEKNHKKEINKAKSLTRIRTIIKEVKQEDDKKVSKITIKTFNELRKLQEARKEKK